MKRKHIILAVILLSTIIYSCKKNAVQEISGPVSGAQVKFFNFALNGPSVNFYANNLKISAVTSATGVEFASGTNYSLVFPATNNYAVIAPGTYNLKSVTPTTAAVNPNTIISSLSKNIEDGKFYSLYTCGLYNTTAKTSDAFILDDALPPIDTSTAYVRFVHVSYNANPFDFIMKNTTTLVETTVATNVAFKTGSAYAKVPSGVYDLILRYPNTTTPIVIRTAVGLVKANTYSFSLRGDITIPYTAAATVVNRPFIDNTPNR
ncbi:DUF4397 domain-containing protein [Pedobacter polaris]|uniref:DUF4397 domain-containing protein n=1 Tax=Pedobacter polaris TaxID=2571273 RepID=A0A4U1CTB3_9SPHI|nr:DUF4397 domain-containing protein [Pedobacter polaris]TKC12427.1 DUF4397 domain-containing protein [Pedobacter polaris]